MLSLVASFHVVLCIYCVFQTFQHYFKQINLSVPLVIE